MTTKDLENGTSTNKDESGKTAPLLCSSRFSIFILFMVGTAHFMMQRQCISFALVCMVKSVPVEDSNLFPSNFTDSIDIHNNDSQLLLTTRRNQSLALLRPGGDNDDDEEFQCKKEAMEAAAAASNETTYREGEFEWSKEVQGGILGSFFYGFVLTQVLGGWISDNFGGKKALLSTSIIFSILTLLNPLAARLGPEFLFGLRLIQGLSHGAVMPCINVISARWSGASERAFLIGVAYGGISVGVAIIFPISALLCELAGWPYIFYVTGGIGLIWCIALQFVLYDWPEEHPRISEEELLFLQKNRAVAPQTSSKNKQKTPWAKIFTSAPVNALHISHFCLLWCFQTLSMYLPMFMKEVLHMNVRNNGIFSSLPYVGMLVLHLGVGRLFDSLRAKELCSLTHLRKWFNTIGTVFPSISLLAVVFLTCRHYVWGTVAISAGQTFVEFAMMGGYVFSVFEIAPRYAGILTGLMNTFGVIPGFLCPIFVSFMTANGTREEWLIVFYVACGINLFGSFIYLVFGTCELQKWAAQPVPDKEMTPLSHKLTSGNGTSAAEESKSNGESNLLLQNSERRKSTDCE